MRAHQGWTLVETAVAVALAATVMLVVTLTLINTSRVTRIQTQRSLHQGRLQVVVRQAERMLRNSSPAGVSFGQANPNGKVLAAHCLEEGNLSGAPRWDAFWTCMVWDSVNGRLFLTRNPSSVVAPLQSRPQAMTPADLNTLMLGPLPGPQGRLLADRITHFYFSLEPGPLFRLEVEVDIPGRQASSKMRVVKLLQPRN